MRANGWRTVAAVLVCGTAEQIAAIELPVVNPSFEEPYIWDLLGCPACGQPTGAQNPDGWTTIEIGGTADNVALDGRWNPDWYPGGTPSRGATAGPSDGVQALLLDNRNGTSDGTIEQDLGTLGALGIGGGSGANRVVMHFDARFGEYNRAPNTGNATEDPDINFFAYFIVDGVRRTDSQFVENLGTGVRTFPAWSELDPAPPDVNDPAQANGHPDNMGHFSVELPLAGIADSAVLGIGFQYLAENQPGCCDSRTYLDNVRVEADAALAVPEIIEVGRTGSVITITWSSRDAVNYILDYSLDLATWPDLNDNVPSQGQTTTETIDIDADIGEPVADRIFFRVREM